MEKNWIPRMGVESRWDRKLGWVETRPAKLEGLKMDYPKVIEQIREDIGAAYGPEEQARFDKLKHCNPAGVLADCFPGLYHLYKASFIAELAREWFNRTFPKRAT